MELGLISESPNDPARNDSNRGRLGMMLSGPYHSQRFHRTWTGRTDSVLENQPWPSWDGEDMSS